MANKRIGVITPSLNTLVEPVTCELLQGLPDVTAHFSRVRVTEIALSGAASAQFATERMVEAARLLADAKVDAICWNGTSGGWLGREADQAICRAITAETGIPATSATLAIQEIFALSGVARYGLVTPYRAKVQEAIVGRYAEGGFACVAEAHLDLDDGHGYAGIAAETLSGMIRQVAEAKPQAITTMCTNIKGAPLAPAMEAETGVPLYDSISATLWKTLLLAGVDPRRVQGWGCLFQDVTTVV